MPFTPHFGRFLAAIGLVGGVFAIGLAADWAWRASNDSRLPRSYEGLVVVPKEGWAFATFKSLSLLRKNEATPGRQRVDITCLTADSTHGAMSSALAQSAVGQGGARAVWVRFTAQPRFETGPCMTRYTYPSSRPYRRAPLGDYLDVRAVQSAVPIACGHIDFIMHHRRCPARQPASVIR